MTVSPARHRVTSTVRRYWDRRAPSYDTQASTSGTQAAWCSAVRSALERAGVDGGTALDVGCGTGLLTEALHGAGLTVHGIDLSAGMLAVARQRLALHGAPLAEHDALLDGDSLVTAGIPVPQAGYQVIAARNVLWTLPDPAAALASWGSLLAPGGLVLIADGQWNKPGALLTRVLDPRPARRIPFHYVWTYLAGARGGRALPLWRGLDATALTELAVLAGLEISGRHEDAFSEPPYGATEFVFATLRPVELAKDTANQNNVTESVAAAEPA